MLRRKRRFRFPKPPPNAGKSFVLGVVVAAAVMVVLAHQAPRPVHVPTRTTHEDDVACGYFGPAVSSVKVNTAGPYPLYDVVCKSGVPIQVAHVDGP